MYRYLKPGFVLGVIIILIGFQIYKSNLQKNDDQSMAKQEGVSQTITPSAEVVQTPATNDPSERALRAAIYFYNNISKERQKKMRETWGGGSEDYRNAVREFATMLDSKKETLIEVEMMIEDYKAKKGQGVSSTYSDSVSESGSALNQLQQQQTQRCQEDIAKYNTCLAEYNSELAEYNACQAGNSDPDKMFKSYCSKPYNSCFKPICAY